MGASLLVLKNKSDVPGSMDEVEVRQVGPALLSPDAAALSRSDLVYRDYNWTLSRRTDGRLCRVALLPASISRRDWIG